MKPTLKLIALQALLLMQYATYAQSAAQKQVLVYLLLL